ncbi:carbonate dehydratase [Thermoflavimicrobium daqui]|uniref:Carbonate dehydratase n=1 Tax=Thermoflavimicrobium daqui TaxID=2137476 RepID=A0A364K669_9BACL|nr:carbonate dehydratase [Thermoflavimicrobium daqui]RAL25805.1 carbonate dehydratase [Thermoflavimicrobium daqui]
MIGKHSLHSILFHNPPVREAPFPTYPTISRKAVIGSNSVIIGDIRIAKDVFIGFHNVLRADASPPFYIGPRTNIQDFVIMHCHPGESICLNNEAVGVYIEGDVSVLHHAAVHGPLFIGHNTLIGQHASIYGATIGCNCVIMHGAVITNHVKIADNRFVAPGQSVYTQRQADDLPEVPQKYKNLNPQIVDYYYRLGKSYHKNTPLTL